MKNIVFQGKIEKGEFVPNSVEYYRHNLKKFEGKEVGMALVPKKRTRSLNQNSTMWWWLEILSEHTGHTPEELHKLFKGLHLPKKFINFKGKDYALAGSTTDLSTSEMMEYMDHIQREAAELGCILPSPDELHSI